MSNGVDFRKIALDLRDQLNAALAREALLQEELEKSGSAEHLRARVAFLTKEIHEISDRLAASNELLRESSKEILRHQACQPMSKRLCGLLTKARTKIDRHLKGITTDPAKVGKPQ